MRQVKDFKRHENEHALEDSSGRRNKKDRVWSQKSKKKRGKKGEIAERKNKVISTL